MKEKKKCKCVCCGTYYTFYNPPEHCYLCDGFVEEIQEDEDTT